MRFNEPLTGPPSLLIAYSGVAYDQHELFRALRDVSGAPVVGGSSQGVSIPGKSVEQARFLGVAAISGVSCSVAGVDNIIEASSAGRELARGLGPAPSRPHATLLYYDPLCGANVQDLLDALADSGFPSIYGAATGQPWGKLVRTWQFLGDRVAEQGAAAVVIHDLELVADLTHGAEAVGLELTVTKADGNEVQEIDGRPALDVWCEQLGIESVVMHQVNIANWALGVEPPDGEVYEGLITRAPFAFDEEKRALIFQAPITQGSRVQVCMRGDDKVYEGAMAMAKRMERALQGKDPILALGFECGARPPFLGTERAAEEICSMQAVIGADIPWLGNYAWGEIAPIGSRTHFHNFTFPLCVLVHPAGITETIAETL